MCSVQGRVRSCKSPWMAHGACLTGLDIDLLALLYIPWLYSGNWLFFVTSPDPATSILLSIPCYKNPKEENKMLKYSVSALSQNLGNLKRNAVFITGLMALLISGAPRPRGRALARCPRAVLFQRPPPEPAGRVSP